MFHYRNDPRADGAGVAFTADALDLSDSQDAAARARAFSRLSDALGVGVVVVSQVHGNDVCDAAPAVDAIVGGLGVLTDPASGAPVRADALWTDRRRVALAVRVADCVPVLFADPDAGLVAAAHAGRAGILSGVIPATVAALRAGGASDLRAWIGPHICAACYEVPPAMADDYATVTGIAPATTRWGTTGLDLGAATHAQLDAAGVRWSSHEACTLHESGLHSHRGAGAAAGRLAGLVWLP